MENNPAQSLSKKDIEELLNAQTITILSAVDEKFTAQDRKIAAMEAGFNDKLDKLMTTLPLSTNSSNA